MRLDSSAAARTTHSRFLADEEYFAELQSRLSSYDAVLYELVADTSRHAPGARWRPPPPSALPASRGFVSAVQTAVASLLSLSFQLRQLDYSGERWFHADCTLQQFQALQRSSGESLSGLAWRAYLDTLRGLAAQLVSPLPATTLRQALRARARLLQALLPVPLVAHLALSYLLSSLDARPAGQRGPTLPAVLFSSSASSALKLLLADALTRPELSGGLLGSERARRSVLLGARNEAAMASLRTSLDGGAHRVAIFYGAAHLPDLEARLAAQGFQRSGEPAWLDAWRIRVGGETEKQLSGLQGTALLVASAVLAADLVFWESIYQWVLERV